MQMRVSLQKAFILLAIVVYWSPFDPLFYLVGPASLAFLILHRRSLRIRADNPEMRRMNWCLYGFLFVFLVSGLANLNHINNLAWALLSYGAVFAVLMTASSMTWEESHFRFLSKAVLWSTLIQLPIGYIQMIGGHGFAALNPFSLNMGAGDYFAGTTLDRFNSTTVALKMATGFFLAFPFWEKAKTLGRTALMGVLALGWILPSVMHSLVVGMGAYFFRQGLYAIRPMLQLRMSKGILTAVLVGGAVLATIFWIQRDNIRYVTGLAARAIGNEQLAPRKVKYVRSTFGPFLAESWQYPWIGCGPGNYSSRGAAIVSGEFLTRQPAYIPATPAPMAEKYVIPLWNRTLLKNPFTDGVANAPYSTWVSVFAETGIIGLVLFAGFLLAIWKRLRLHKASASPFMANLASGAELLLLFAMGLFFLDDWFEYPSFMGVLMLLFGMFMSRRVEGAGVREREPAMAESKG